MNSPSVPPPFAVADSAFEHAALIALDWGTTSLRAYLFDGKGSVIADCASAAGIMNLPHSVSAGGFDAAFEDACGVWLDRVPRVPVIAAGMVGSAQGWAQVPYVDTPADEHALAAKLVPVGTERGVAVHIVPGVIERGELPNVMRGEETQIVGAFAGDAALSSDSASALIGLPGTHAKWAVVRGSRIERFHTFMTGEVFAALRDHTILGRTMADPATPDTEAFLRGVAVARRTDHAGLLATIFSSRTLGLTGQLCAQAQSEYLSGLLIGHELCGLAAVYPRFQSEPLRLIGNEALCERYRLALAQLGCTQPVLVKDATERGLWRIAALAGLVGEARRSHAQPAG
jgi:2-dehydro-3-deoxygalactonokinase